MLFLLLSVGWFSYAFAEEVQGYLGADEWGTVAQEVDVYSGKSNASFKAEKAQEAARK